MQNIAHTRTKVKNPQPNGIVERFHQTMRNEFSRMTFRKKIYSFVRTPEKYIDCMIDSSFPLFQFVPSRDGAILQDPCQYFHLHRALCLR